MKPPVTRDALLARLSSARHALLCGPSGYGKSTLLRQYAERVTTSAYVTASDASTAASLCGAASAGCATLKDLERAGVTALLVDDLGRMPLQGVTDLFRQLGSAGLQVICADYHSHYPFVQQLLAKGDLLLLTTSALAFTQEESAGQCAKLPYVQTAGWPSVVRLSGSAHFDLASYLDDLIAVLPETVQEQLNTVTDSAAADALVVEWEVNGQRGSVLSSGFPLIDGGGRFIIHPLMVSRLTNRLTNRPPSTSSTFDLYFSMARGMADVGKRNHILESYFSLFGETDASTRASINMLTIMPFQELTPPLRDRLADLHVTARQTEDAERILAYQRATQQVSSLTYTVLARVANYNNDIPALNAYSQQALETASTPIERSRALGMLSLAMTRTEGGRYEEALELAEQRYQVALKSESPREEISSYWSLINAYQYLGRVEAGITAARRARLKGQGQRQLAPVLLPVLNELADQLKAKGEYTEALEVIQEALSLNEGEPTNSMPYTLFTRGLIYLELGRNDDAHQTLLQSIEGFKIAQIWSGLLLPYAFLAFVQWRQGWFEDTEATYEATRLVVERLSMRADYVEWRAYVPLVEGIYHIGQQQPERALAALRTVLVKGHEVYDSVLLTLLLICHLELELSGAVPLEDAQAFIDVLDVVADLNDQTLRAYAADFTPVLRYLISVGFYPERLSAALQGHAEPVPAKPSYRIEVTTLGGLGITVNGEPIATENHYPVYTLAYLALQPTMLDGHRRYVTSSMLADDLYAGQRPTAQSSVSFLRRALHRRDPELGEELLSPRGDRHGYRLRTDARLHVSVDVDVYLGLRFTPSNPDISDLWELMRNYRPFFELRALTSDSAFVTDLNERLLRRFKKVSLGVMEAELIMQRPQSALLALLLYLRHDQDYEVIDSLTGLLEQYPSSAVQVSQLITAIQLEDDDVFQSLVESAIQALAAA